MVIIEFFNNDNLIGERGIDFLVFFRIKVFVGYEFLIFFLIFVYFGWCFVRYML